MITYSEIVDSVKNVVCVARVTYDACVVYLFPHESTPQESALLWPQMIDFLRFKK